MLRWRPQIAAAANRFGVPERWIERVIWAESRGRTRIDGRPTTSRAGAMGLMQLMPGTWAEMRSAHGLGADPHDPGDNILAGTAYLRAMYERFGYPGLFAAYNAGPARYAAHLKSGGSLPAETRFYLAAVTGRGPAVPQAGGAGTATTGPVSGPPSLFAVHRPPAAGHASGSGSAAVADPLFSLRKDP
ncbi:lytic transglycosylase domain-containing protein [Allosphingosinicella deserti]